MTRRKYANAPTMHRLIVRNVGATKVLTVPKAIVEVLPAGQEFIPELTDEGILYRAVAPHKVVDKDNLPAWITGSNHRETND